MKREEPSGHQGEKIRLGISRCLLGDAVRYDGGHKRDPWLVETLGRYVEYVPVCPEVELGLPTPREALRLVGAEDEPRLVFSRSGEDITEAMREWARVRVKELEKEGLCGFIFKSKSPSSGMERVKLYTAQGMAVKKGVGLFARAFMEHFPLLPVEEEGRLNDPVLRENFIECLFTFKRYRTMLAQGRSRGGLVNFHTRHKLLLLAHSPQVYREMGRLVATADRFPEGELFHRYETLLMKAMQLRPTVKKHVNVLHHLMGYFKKNLTPDEKQELLDVIDRYAGGTVPLVVPLTLLNHYVRKYDQPYLKEQVYLQPHPLELKLRNHA